MIRHENKTVWEFTFEATVRLQGQLAWQTRISTDVDLGWGPPLRESSDENGKRLFGESDVVIVELGINHLERQANELSGINPVVQCE